MHSMASTLWPLALCLLSVTVAFQQSLTFRGHDVEDQTITVTSGECGDLCPENKFKCASTAVCTGSHCMCPPGYFGHPQFFCFPIDAWFTMVYGDPKVQLYNGETAHLNIPCLNELTHVITKHTMGREGGQCDMQVSIITHHLNRGYYILGVDLKLVVTDKAHPQAGQLVTIRMYGYENNGFYEYKEQRQDTTLDTRLQRKHTAQIEYMSNMVGTRFDYLDNLAIIESEACGFTLMFKAYVRYTWQLPGMMFFVRKDCNPRFPDYASQLGGSPFQPSQLRSLKHKMSLTKEEAMLFIALGQKRKQNFGIEALSCIIAIKEYNSMCRNDMDRVFAIKVCGFIFIQRGVSECLQAGEFGQNVASMFALCAQAMCLRHVFLCMDLREELNMYSCDTPDIFKNMNCFQISKTLNAVYGSGGPLIL